MTRIDPSLRALLDLPPEQRKIGPFTLASSLGGDAYAPVWRAQQWLEGEHVRDVAVKLFGTRGGASGPSEPGDRRRQRILKEVRALCRVNHPNIVHFYELVTDDAHGVVGLVMELLEGTSLDERVFRGPLSVADSIAVGIAIASALSAVHRAGLVHRDVKPANVIASQGVYKLVGFGIAAAEPSAPGGRQRMIVVPDLAIGLLGTKLGELDGRVLRGELAPGDDSGDRPFESLGGTLGYVDPVCVSQLVEENDGSDLYALGVTLFECLTGSIPAAVARGGEGLKGEVLDGTRPSPPLASKRPDVPKALAELVDALLDPRREKRPASAADVEATLRRIQAEPATRAPAPGPAPAPTAARPPQVLVVPAARPQRTVPAKYVLLGIAVLLLGGGGLVSYLSERQTDREIQEHWSRVSACILGAPLQPGEKPSIRVRNIELAADTAPKSKDPNQWGGPWPNRCAPYVRNLRAHLEKAGRADKWKHDVAWHLEQLAPAMESTSPSRSIVDDTWAESVKEALVAGPAPDVPPPPAPARPLFTIDTLDKLVPFVGPKGLVFESPHAGGNEVVMLAHDEAWRLCTIAETSASCAPVPKEIKPPVSFVNSADVEPGADALLVEEPDFSKRAFSQKIYRPNGELVAEVINVNGAISRADAAGTVTIHTVDERGTSYLIEQERGKAPIRKKAPWLENATYRWGLAFGNDGRRFTTADGKARSYLDVTGTSLCKTATGLLLYDREKMSVYQDGTWSAPVTSDVSYARSMSCSDAPGRPTGTRLLLSDDHKVLEERCSAAGCAKATGDTGPLGDAKDVKIVRFADRIGLVWSSKDAVKARVAPLAELGSAPTTVVFDATISEGTAGHLDRPIIQLAARERFALLLLGTKTGRRLFRLGTDGSITPLTL